MKEWPDGNGTVDCEDLLAPLVEAVHHYYGEGVQYWHHHPSFDYQGYDIGQEDKAVALGASVFEEFNMEWQLEDQGLHPLELILLLAFQLGVEQGRRLTRDKIERSRGRTP